MNRASVGLSPAEVSLLVRVRDGEASRKSIAKVLGAPPSELTRLVKSLESNGFIVVHKQGISSSISFSEMKHAALLRRILNEFSHMRLERILSLASLDIIACLAVSPGSTRHEIMSCAGVSAKTLQTGLKRLKDLGVVRVRTRGVYETSDRFQLFSDFAREFNDYSNERTAREFCPDSVVVWQHCKEFITKTRCEKENADFKTTAFSMFNKYGVPLFQEWHYYYHHHGVWRRTPDEVFLQSLLVRPRSSREMTAILMLWERNALNNHLDRLQEKARRYGLEDELQSIIAYFKDPKKNREAGFPPMSELREKLRSQG